MKKDRKAEDGVAVFCAHTKMVATAELKPHPKNPNRHPKEQLRLLAKIIKTHGWRSPIVVSKRSNLIIKGHGRLEAAKLLGLKKVPVEYQDYKNQAMEWADLIADNRLAELAEMDENDLGALLKQLDKQGFDLELTGFNKDDVADLLRHIDPEDLPDSEPQFDRAKELGEKWGTAAGDLWLIGEHKLVCADASNAKHVAQLGLGDGADFIFTSPPYNVGVDYAAHDDTQAKWPDYEKFLTSVLDVIIPMLKTGRAIGWNIGTNPKTFHVRQHLMMETRYALAFYRQMIWKKVGVPVPVWHNTVDNPVARQFTPNYQHEVVLLFTKGELEKGAPTSIDPLCEHDVFQLHQTSASKDLESGSSRVGAQSNLETRALKVHPAAFPVRLPAMFITHFTAPGESVIEPFCGSGSTMVACEGLGRRCHGIELSPAYCGVILQRMKDTFPELEIRKA